jgi:hypothetical protein
MNRRLAAAVTALVPLPPAGCAGGSTTTDAGADTIDQAFTALVVDSPARPPRAGVPAGAVTVEPRS